MRTLKDRFPNMAIFITLVAIAVLGLGFVQLQYNSVRSDGGSSLWFFISAGLMMAYAYRVSDFRKARVRQRRQDEAFKMVSAPLTRKGNRSANGTYAFDNLPASGSFRTTAKAKEYTREQISELSKLSRR